MLIAERNGYKLIKRLNNEYWLYAPNNEVIDYYDDMNTGLESLNFITDAE